MRFNWLVAAIVLLTVFWVQATTTGLTSSEDDRYELTARWPASCQDLLSTQLSVYGVSVGDTEESLLPALKDKDCSKFRYSSSKLWCYQCGVATFDVSADGTVEEISVLAPLTCNTLFPSALEAALIDWDLDVVGNYWGPPDYEFDGVPYDLDMIAPFARAYGFGPSALELLSAQKQLGFFRGFEITRLVLNEDEDLVAIFFALIPPMTDLHRNHPDWDWELCKAVATGKVSEKLAERCSYIEPEVLELIGSGALQEWRALQHPDWGYWNWRNILEGRIKEFMTTEMVRESWGAPDRITRYNFGRTEFWYYANIRLHFVDGYLSGWN